VLPDFLADAFQEDIMAHSLDKIGGNTGGNFHKLQIKTYNNVRYAITVQAHICTWQYDCTLCH